MHRPPDGGLIVELEPVVQPQWILRRLLKGRRSNRLSHATALAHSAMRRRRFSKRIAGYDRVMVYRFDEDGHGEVFSEMSRNPIVEAFLGNRYPASDIPQIARRLYDTKPRANARGCRLRTRSAQSQAVAPKRSRPGHVALLASEVCLLSIYSTLKEYGRGGDAGDFLAGGR